MKDLATYQGEGYVNYRRKLSILIPWPDKTFFPISILSSHLVMGLTARLVLLRLN